MAEFQAFAETLRALGMEIGKSHEDAGKGVEAAVWEVERFARGARERLNSHARRALNDAHCVDAELGSRVDRVCRGAAQMVEAFEGRVRRERDQLRLRAHFEDTVIVFAAGKVKSGKSRAGDFVASLCGNTEFFMCDRAGCAHASGRLEELGGDEDGFGVGDTELTSRIQGFRSDGPTWIDTPGLHSMTGENGELSRRYLAAADLVLYMMSSDSPARASDIKEPQELAGACGKRFTVVITKSDTPDVDEVDGEIVNTLRAKSPEARREQEDWTRAEINGKVAGASLMAGEVMSVSVRLAEESLGRGDAEGLRDSHAPAFVAMLRGITLRRGGAAEARGAVGASPRIRPVDGVRRGWGRGTSGDVRGVREHHGRRVAGWRGAGARGRDSGARSRWHSGGSNLRAR